MQEFVAHELEVLVSTVDAERTLQQLLEDRATLNSQLNELTNIIQDERMNQQYKEAVERESIQVKQELELRNAQIADLQQKILDSDQENKMNTRWDAIQSMADAKAALKHVFNVVADIRRDAITKDYALKEMKELQQTYENNAKKILELEKEIKKMKEKHEEQILLLEKEHQENLHCLLNNENKENEPRESHVDNSEENMGPPSTHHIGGSLTPKNRRVKKRRSAYREFEDLNMMMDGSLISEDDDVEKDPDWKNTPIHRRLMALKTKSILPQLPDSRKRSLDGSFRCGCHSNCNTKRCVCFKMDGKCGDSCTCSSAKCIFKTSEVTAATTMNQTFIKCDEESDDHKKPRYTFTLPNV